MTGAREDFLLVILAGGIGRRYGSEKQIAGVGPNGEWLLEYAIHDALAAGFARVVIVVRPALRDAFAQRLRPVLRGRAQLHLVEQSPRERPAGCRAAAAREKPLGTGHALWCCRIFLDAPFVVINADDYYGPDAFALLGAHLRDARTPAMVGYRLDRTLSPHGSVNRALCSVDELGRLRRVEEFIDIRLRDGVLHGRTASGADTRLDPHAIVSLNCWGLLPDLIPDLETGLIRFLRRGKRRRIFPAPRHRAAPGAQWTARRGIARRKRLAGPHASAGCIAGRIAPRSVACFRHLSDTVVAIRWTIVATFPLPFATRSPPRGA